MEKRVLFFKVGRQLYGLDVLRTHGIENLANFTPIMNISPHVKGLMTLRGEVKEIGWGSQIRTYTMQPYKLVKDHRTNEEVGNVGAVLDGELDPFINAYLKSISK